MSGNSKDVVLEIERNTCTVWLPYHQILQQTPTRVGAERCSCQFPKIRVVGFIGVVRDKDSFGELVIGCRSGVGGRWEERGER